MKKFKLLLEDVSNSVSNIAGVRDGDEPPCKPGCSNIVRRKFAGVETFEVTDDVYLKCINGKKKTARYEKYVGMCPTGQAIREYGRKNPKKSIILQNSATGSMIYFKKK